MRYLDLSLPTPAENLALDEALVEEADRQETPFEVLRLWEPWAPMVVVGRSSQIAGEVHEEACRAEGVPIFRRSSGGAAIVTGPGCLMYALVLSYAQDPALRAVDRAHQFVLGRLIAALRPLASDVRCRGTSDLAIGELKFSGNSVRCKRRHMLYHGTLLLDFPLELIDRFLAMPARQPDYRARRPHRTFVANLSIPGPAVRAALRSVWNATESYDDWPSAETARLAAEKYARPEWNERGLEVFSRDVGVR